MYATGPAHSGDVAGEGLAVSRAERLAFDGASDLARNPDHHALLGVYLADLLRPYGIPFEAGILHQGRGQSYGEMAEAVLNRAVGPDLAVDLLVLAFAVPDLTPGRATAAYLSHVCPGNRLAFAICDQGVAAAFTGLRLIQEYIGTGGCRRGLLVVVEQADLLYEPPAPAAVPSTHAAVALLCGEPESRSAGPGWTARLAAVRLHPDVPPARVDGLLATEVAALAAGRANVTLVLGAADLKPPDLGRVRVAPAGQPYTGVWWELAGELAETTADRRVVLADYDPALRYLCLSAIDVSAADGVSAVDVPAGAGQRHQARTTR
jgi:4-hydroxymandelate oxidase